MGDRSAAQIFRARIVKNTFSEYNIFRHNSKLMESAEHAELEEWARVFGGTAILGFISTLLLGGKFLHHVFQRRGLVFGLAIVPPAMLSGLVGLLWFLGQFLLASKLAAHQ